MTSFSRFYHSLFLGIIKSIKNLICAMRKRGVIIRFTPVHDFFHAYRLSSEKRWGSLLSLRASLYITVFCIDFMHYQQESSESKPSNPIQKSKVPSADLHELLPTSHCPYLIDNYSCLFHTFSNDRYFVNPQKKKEFWKGFKDGNFDLKNIIWDYCCSLVTGFRIFNDASFN